MSDAPQIVSMALELDPPDAAALRKLLALRPGPVGLDEAIEALDALADLRDAEEKRLRALRETGHGFRRIAVGNAVLESPTLAARAVMFESQEWPVPADWLEAGLGAEWSVLVQACILAHSRNAAVLESMCLPGPAAALVRDWARGVTASPEELSEAVAELSSGWFPPLPADSAKKKSRRMARARSCAALCRRTAAIRVIGSIASPLRTLRGCFDTWVGRPARNGMRCIRTACVRTIRACRRACAGGTSNGNGAEGRLSD